MPSVTNAILLVVPAVLAGSGWLLPQRAAAEPLPYRGPHPVDAAGEWHMEESVHVHDTLPVGLEPFVEVDGVMIFLGDPDAYGYEGTSYRYDGAHPLPARDEGYCGISGEHRHAFAPEGSFEIEDGVHRYTGAMRGGVRSHRPARLVPEEGEVERERSATALIASPFWAWPRRGLRRRSLRAGCAGAGPGSARRGRCLRRGPAHRRGSFRARHPATPRHPGARSTRARSRTRLRTESSDARRAPRAPVRSDSERPARRLETTPPRDASRSAAGSTGRLAAPGGIVVIRNPGRRRRR